ncbi:MAG: TIGR04423 family type III CRISPR-associated protein [Saprospiraceae bacterium]|nr:TIGR04423 family type III CRISPR-associated protein [Saprospiraceae bacterium]
MEEIAKKLPGLDKIPHSDKWTGYVWYSDQQNPEILKEQALVVQTGNSKFIIEALLHDGVSKSIHILHTHQYQITEYDLSNIRQYETKEVKFIAAGRLQEKVKELMFKQVWVPIENQNCQKLEVLQMQGLIFTGLIF